MDQSKNSPWQVTEEDSNKLPRIVVATDSDFLGFYLARELLDRETEVYYFPNGQNSGSEIKRLRVEPRFHLLDKNIPEFFDYLFQINFDASGGQKIQTSKFLELVHKAGAKFVMATVNRENFSRHFFAEFSRRKKIDWRLVHFYYVYGSGMSKDSFLGTLFSQVSGGRILIPGKGEEKIYPLFITDFIQGLLRAMFLQGSAERLFTLIGIQAVSALDFVWKIKKVASKNFEIIYIPSYPRLWPIDSLVLEKNKKSWWRLVYKPKISCEEGISLTLKGNLKITKNFFQSLTYWFGGLTSLFHLGYRSATKQLDRLRLIESKQLIPKPILKNNTLFVPSIKVFSQPVAKPTPSLVESQTEEKSQEAVKQVKFFSFSKIVVLVCFILICLLIIISPFLLFAKYTLDGFRQIQQVSQKMTSGDYQNLDKKLEQAKNNLVSSQKILEQFSPFISFIGIAQRSEGIENYLKLSLDLVQSLASATQVLEKGRTLTQIIFQNEIGDPKQELSDLLVDLSLVQEKLAFAQIEYTRLPQIQIPLFSFDQQIKPWLEKLPELRQKITFGQQLLSLVPQFLSFDGKRSYLVLLQNNMELRPTGGFIGSYGVLTFEKGKFLDFRVEDVYSADGQLKGHVEPPPELKKYLGQATWYLRDSNWSEDFPTAAAQAEWFLEKEIGQRVDGTIAVNLNFVKTLLQVVGPVQLPEYKEQITADNLFERAEYYTEVDFFPGSTQKKSFLATLSNFLFEKLKELPPPSYLDLFSYWENNLTKKDIMMAFHDKTLQDKIETFGWNGEIRRITFNKTSDFLGPGIIDYVSAVDANVGVNKANYFITREINYETSVMKEGQLQNKLSLIYHNSSPSDSWPGGIYKNYLRILLPADVDKMIIRESREDGTQGKIIPSKEITKKIEFGKIVFGFYIEIPAGESKKITANFDRVEKLPVNQAISDYVFYFQKQSGTRDDPLTVKLNFPAFLKPVKLMPKGTWKTQSVVFKSNFDSDKLFAVEFSH